MKNKSLILIIGESTGLECFKNLLKLNYFKIFLVVSVDFNYHYIIKKICKKNYIKFQTSSQFKKNFHKINFTKNQKYILLSIFSNLILYLKFYCFLIFILQLFSFGIFKAPVWLIIFFVK